MAKTFADYWAQSSPRLAGLLMELHPLRVAVEKIAEVLTKEHPITRYEAGSGFGFDVYSINVADPAPAIYAYSCGWYCQLCRQGGKATWNEGTIGASIPAVREAHKRKSPKCSNRGDDGDFELFTLE